jgi:hypothetical protein
VRDALLELVPDSPVHATMRGLLLDPTTDLVGDELGACVIDRARGLGAVIGAPSAATLASAVGAIEWVSRRPWPSLSGAWERARVAVPGWIESSVEGSIEVASVGSAESAGSAADGSTHDDVHALTAADLSRVEPELVPELELALSRGALARARTRNGELVSVAYVVTSTEAFADLGVDTRAAHRRRGHARAVTASLVAAVIASGRTPVMGALDSNRASIALADSLGFVPAGTLWVAP